MAYKIVDIEGIGPVYAEKLNAAGIVNADQLLEKCAATAGRKALEEETGISGKRILTWTNHADLYRVKGIGPQFAELLEADMLVILTSVDKVCLNFGTDEEKALDTLSVADAKKYLEAGELEEGTMAPKIEAAIEFIGESAIKSVLITKLNKEGTEISGGMGTLIKK